MNEVTATNPMVSADLAPDSTPGLSPRSDLAQSFSAGAQPQSPPHGFAPSLGAGLDPASYPATGQSTARGAQLHGSSVEDASEFESGDKQADSECYEFQELMSERIVAGQRLQEHPHMLTCERCRGLVRDLEAIAEAARQLVPMEVEPKRDLWAKISSAIEKGDA